MTAPDHTGGQSDKDKNFQALRQQLDEAIDQRDEAQTRAQAAEQRLETLGFDPSADVSSQEGNLAALRESKDDWKSRAEAYGQVLGTLGFDISDDGSFDPDQVARLSADEERVRRATLVEAGFDPESAYGKSLARDLATGQIELAEGQDPAEAVRAFADAEYGWRPQAYLTRVERDAMYGSDRLEALQDASMSEAAGDQQTEIEQQIAEAREAGDFERASILEDQYQQRHARNR